MIGRIGVKVSRFLLSPGLIGLPLLALFDSRMYLDEYSV